MMDGDNSKAGWLALLGSPVQKFKQNHVSLLGQRYTKAPMILPGHQNVQYNFNVGEFSVRKS